MLGDIKTRLKHIGYEPAPEDDPALMYVSDRITGAIMDTCGSDVPELIYAAVDMACGEFLLMKKAAGGLEGFNPDMAVKQIQEGDTSVTFDVESGSPEKRMDALIGYLMRGRDELKRYRCFKW